MVLVLVLAVTLGPSSLFAQTDPASVFPLPGRSNYGPNTTTGFRIQADFSLTKKDGDGCGSDAHISQTLDPSTPAGTQLSIAPEVSSGVWVVTTPAGRRNMPFDGTIDAVGRFSAVRTYTPPPGSGGVTISQSYQGTFLKDGSAPDVTYVNHTAFCTFTYRGTFKPVGVAANIQATLIVTNSFIDLNSQVPVTITARGSNTGSGTGSKQYIVRAYGPEPSAPAAPLGELGVEPPTDEVLGTVVFDLPAGESADKSVSWQPDRIGDYTIQLLNPDSQTDAHQFVVGASDIHWTAGLNRGDTETTGIVTTYYAGEHYTVSVAAENRGNFPGMKSLTITIPEDFQYYEMMTFSLAPGGQDIQYVDWSPTDTVDSPTLTVK